MKPVEVLGPTEPFRVRSQDEQFEVRHDARAAALMLDSEQIVRIENSFPPILQTRAQVRIFESGATRDDAAHKLDFEGFFDPAVLQRFAEFMHGHRFQGDGSVRDSDNWQHGIPLSVYAKSLARHFMRVWQLHRKVTGQDEDARVSELEAELCAIIFNAQGYLSELLKAQRLGGVAEASE